MAAQDDFTMLHLDLDVAGIEVMGVGQRFADQFVKPLVGPLVAARASTAKGWALTFAALRTVTRDGSGDPIAAGAFEVTAEHFITTPRTRVVLIEVALLL